jgi:dephospho-CoA kinase
MNLKPEFQKLTPKSRLYQLPVPIIGLTGGIASGKSTVAEILSQKGLAMINADQLVKDIYALPETLEFLNLHHPEVLKAKKIDFRMLREKVFKNPEVKTQIEKFIYQRLPAAFMNAYHKLQDPKLVVYDVPLLFEKNLESLMDVSVLVYAPRNIQRTRLMSRDSIAEELAESILKQQMDIEDKKQRAEFVINNSLTKEELTEEIEQFLRQIVQ